mmetsp:Transcript_23685/g.40173  ORF Transcript_23685/g.40173 Transcript_23685/m.40173 type:complete len:252 (-) Transcript_23685:512-1267(-)
MVHHHQETQSQCPEQPIGPLNRRRFVDSVRCRVGIGTQIQPAVAVGATHFDRVDRGIPRIGPFDGIPLHQRTQSTRSERFARIVLGQNIGRTKGPTLQQRTQHTPRSRTVQRPTTRRVHNRKGTMRTGTKQIIHHTSTFHGTQTLDFGTHHLTSHNLVPFSNRRYFRLQKGNILELNVNVVKTLIKDISSETGGHERQHERQHVLHVPGSLQQNNSERNGHPCHPSQDGGGSHESIRSTISKGTTGVIQFV